jgi:SAM-dependent methyltransferase
MSLLDFDDFEGAIRETARVLRPGGVFCIAILHPIVTAQDDRIPGTGPHVVPAPSGPIQPIVVICHSFAGGPAARSCTRLALAGFLVAIAV